MCECDKYTNAKVSLRMYTNPTTPILDLSGTLTQPHILRKFYFVIICKQFLAEQIINIVWDRSWTFGSCVCSYSASSLHDSDYVPTGCNHPPLSIRAVCFEINEITDNMMILSAKVPDSSQAKSTHFCLPFAALWISEGFIFL